MLKEFPQIINKEILKYSQNNKMDSEIFLNNLLPLLDKKYKPVVLKTINFSEYLENLSDYGYEYSIFEDLIRKTEEKEIIIDENSKFIESFVKEFIIKGNCLYLEDILYRGFVILIGENNLLVVLQKYKIIEKLTIQYQFKDRSRIHYFFSQIYENISPETILKIKDKLPEKIPLGKIILS
ncbi:hypothetical protein LCGC14_0904560 [marine sediment metagenome]|uniref:Uncharacterized protein n=1 Tax=marine sediment metagenome TaxID=412755 RepID=A0A0F9PG52_9ZZZZ